MERIRAYLKDARIEMIGMIERMVNVDSGSFYKEGVDTCGRMVSKELEAVGFEIQTIAEREWGNHVRADRPGKGDKRLFLSAHLDTVFPEGASFRNPFRVTDGWAYGPGVGDMKGGIAQMVYALKALRDLDLDTPPISIFLTGDEEVGSIRGRPHIEELARNSSWVIVMEPASAPESIGVRRWGIGSFYLTMYGKAAHVLKPDSQGINACRELALKILALESLSDAQRGVKVSVNLVSGGRSRQVTAAEARADIDVRVRSSADAERVEAQVREIAGKPILPGIRVRLEGHLTRPPMEPNPNTDDLLRLAGDVGREIGLDLVPGEEYGGSDGCFTAALGVATLDAMGPYCLDMCGDEERIDLDSLVPRATLLAGIIHRLAGE